MATESTSSGHATDSVPLSKPSFWERLEIYERAEANKTSKIPRRRRPAILPDTDKIIGEFGNVDEGDYKGWIAKRVALRVAPSVVCLSSFVGDEHLFTCSGIVIDWADNVGTILTSATLLTGHLEYVPSDVTVKVCLPNCEKFDGTVSHFDLHHNIATINMSSSQLQFATLLPSTGSFYPGQNVVALGRHSWTKDLMASYGGIQHIDNGFDSEDLLYSNCHVSEFGIGGPLVDISSGLVLGLNFTGRKSTAFLPSPTVLRCLKHFKTYGRVHRPWLGTRTRDLSTLKVAELEKIYQKFPYIRGIYVDKVIEGSQAASAGVCPGDVITHFNGIPVYSQLEFVGLLFDKAEDIKNFATSDSPVKRMTISLELIIKRGSSGCTESKSIIIDNRLTPSITNTWPLFRARDLKNTFLSRCERASVPSV